jgi:hypothetical protein
MDVKCAVISAICPLIPHQGKENFVFRDTKGFLPVQDTAKNLFVPGIAIFKYINEWSCYPGIFGK